MLKRGRLEKVLFLINLNLNFKKNLWRDGQ
jgi:hypothetical protein